MNRKMLGMSFAGAALAVDQVTKWLAIENAEWLSNGVAIFPGFNLVFLRNYGISFGFLGGTPWWVLVLLTAAIVFALVIWLLRTSNTYEAAGLGLIIGGALGNISDRIRHGAVTDFLDFYAGTMHWPAFNMADTFIFCGAILLLWSNK